MSIETWKQEFYAVEAGILSNDTDVVALRHSIKKWEGLRPGNLERHGLKVSFKHGRSRIKDVEGEILQIDSVSCALCHKYLFSGSMHRCGNCPLSKIRGNVACDVDVDGDDISPFEAWRKGADPEPMLHWLGEALKVATCEEGK